MRWQWAALAILRSLVPTLGLPFIVSCHPPLQPGAQPHKVLQESFDTRLFQWSARPAKIGGVVRSASGSSGDGLRLSSGAAREETLVIRNIDAVELRGHRLVVSARVRAKARADNGRATIRISATHPGMPATTWTTAESEPATADWTQVSVALDVPSDTTDLQVQLVVRGDVDGWFDDVIGTAEPSPVFVARSLGLDEVDRLRVATAVIGYLRFFHPSDESAQANWRRIEVATIQRVLLAHDRHEFRMALDSLVTAVAPTSEIYETGSSPRASAVPQVSGGYLTRWVRYGFGGGVYLTFRDGVNGYNNVDNAAVRLYRRLPVSQLGGCRPLILRKQYQRRTGEPDVDFDISPSDDGPFATGPGKTWNAETGTLVDLPDGATEFSFGVTVTGHGVVAISQLALTCNGKVIADLLADRGELEGVGHELFDVDRNARCDGGSCVTISRLLATTWDEQRDAIDKQIGAGLRLHMPTAVWTDGNTTFPRSVVAPSPPFVLNDLAARVATVIDVWLVLRWFYPYSDDVKINWDNELALVVQKAAVARSADNVEVLVQELIAKLHDGHAFVNRSSIDGILPFKFRRIGDSVVTVDALLEYRDLLPRGSVITAIDEVPIAEVVAQVNPRISAATAAYHDFALSELLMYGRTGELVRMSARTPGSSAKLIEFTVPRLYGTAIGQFSGAHPTSGDEIVAGVYYIDLASISQDQVVGLLPKLTNAKAIICDARGAISQGAWRLIVHMLLRAVGSPRLLTPIATASGPKHYEENRWWISPRLPHIHALPIFLADGGSISQSETLLQMVKGEHLGTIVGENTAGTNGNVIFYDTLGRMKILFTGMRVLNIDGTLLHGQGITPDLVVHSTVDGIAAGRDEILDAARQLAAGH